jgi:cellulose synthase/poly-beta-1,6-N-acetylglucosamine synthase-like glycosyltransferase
MHNFLDWDYWGLSFLGIFIIAWLVQIYFFFFYFTKVAAAKIANEPKGIEPVSIVICARNEEKNLMDNIPAIMDQDFKDFEVVVVNDSSWDDTETILKALHLRYPNMHIINLDEEKQNMQGKKFALTLGIKAAKYDTILLIDADCCPNSSSWISRMTGGIQDKKQLSIGFSPYTKYPGWLNKIIRYDTFLIGLHYLGFAKSGHPYMGVGRNMSYRRELFFSIGGFKSHYSISSGDDDLFVNQVATKYNTQVVIHPESHTISEPKKTWKEWFAQKRRHFTTAPMYKASDKSTLSLWPISFLMMFVGFAGAMVLKNAMLVVGAMLFVRYVVQIAILHASAKKLAQQKDLVWLAPFLEIHLHALNAGLYITNLVRKPQKWN